MDEEETEFLRSKISNLETRNEPVEIFDRFHKLKHSTVRPKAFTDKGLYMLATILKSPKATETTIVIIETYSKLKQFSNAINSLSVHNSESSKQDVIEKGTELIAEIIQDDLKLDETETSIEFNFALVKLKHTVKRKK